MGNLFIYPPHFSPTTPMTLSGCVSRGVSSCTSLVVGGKHQKTIHIRKISSLDQGFHVDVRDGIRAIGKYIKCYPYTTALSDRWLKWLWAREACVSWQRLSFFESCGATESQRIVPGNGNHTNGCLLRCWLSTPLQTKG